ncbi:sensor histidine kinase [Inmirania thermothiophila]|uniref:histidine kinase n=1 Tax=Inmirania thermothiophila TaxID=1750597 RepID=A0A3N1XZU6_9GAMM|nr:sensor histidine kinase [Inmirania thermothiophila]ROR32100.1 Na+/proline symporter [Inmirania thermothiophila]
MLPEGVVVAASAAYLALLFAIAYYGDRRAAAGRSLIANPYTYTLSIAVYCTAWTFYGSVGRAASAGIGFLPIYLGPTLAACLWWVVLRKIVRISKTHRITTIADFIASRYGKSTGIGGLVTVIAVVGITPYIALQLKAVSTSFEVLVQAPAVPEALATRGILADTAFYVALVMALFSILFGTRHLDATERHEGMVAAIAFESVVKLVALTAVGVFAVAGLFDGPAALFARAAADPRLARLLTWEAVPGGAAGWFTLTGLSMAAILFLPRQFQVLVVENVNEAHLRKASWLFPLYLLAINLFVLPLALAGELVFRGQVDPDTYVLALPLAGGREGLALLAFLGGLSAATGMVIVATIALSTMICNDLVTPLLLRLRALEGESLSGLLLAVRRGAIVLILLLGYAYFRLIGEGYALVSMGLVSFAAAAQFAPPILAGIYWRGATRRGALAGLAAGFAVWAYTLFLPAFARSGWLDAGFLETGPWGIALLRPYALLGLAGLDPVTHAVFWSLVANVGLLVGVSLLDRPGPLERVQAELFVDVFRRRAGAGGDWRGSARIGDLQALLARFLGEARAGQALARAAEAAGCALAAEAEAPPGLVRAVERELAGAIGAASARVMVASVVQGGEVGLAEVMEIVDETSQVIEYSRRLEEKSRELERATEELRAANERLQELDRMKDEFVSTVSHELRTPLTSIRAFAEILLSEPEMPRGRRQEFLAILVRETERLSRLVNEVLDLARLESGRVQWHEAALDLGAVVREAMESGGQLLRERGVRLVLRLPREPLEVTGDRDRLTQVLLNLLANAAKFCPAEGGRVEVSAWREGGEARVAVSDNGPGIPPAERERVFDKFHQVHDRSGHKPTGSGLGLAICRHIVEYHGGRIWVEEAEGGGARFVFSLPLAAAQTKKPGAGAPG